MSFSVENKKEAEIQGAEIIVSFSGSTFQTALSQVKSIPGRHFEPKSRVWMIPNTSENVRALQEYGFVMVGEEWESRKEKIITSEVMKIDRSKLDKRLFSYQIENVEFLEASGGRGGLGDPMGLGKLIENGTKVLCKDKWVAVENLVIGDIVCGSDGKFHNVSGVFPQGIHDLFRVTFNDGTTINTCDEHLWSVEHVRNNWKKPRIMSTFELRQNLKDAWGNNNWRIPLVQPIQFPEKKLPLDPYVLGVLIGDGCYSGTGPTSITNPELDILQRVERSLPSLGHMAWYQRKNDCFQCRIHGVDTILKDLGLFGNVANNKHIPNDYLFASVEQRTALLHGLMDTDGCCMTIDGTTQYSSASKQLVDDIQFIIESLGGVARYTYKKEPKYSYEGEIRTGQPSHILTVSIPVNPFWFSRKANLWRPRVKYKPTRIIKAIEPIGSGEGTCIRIDSEDHLFVAEHCILTHNTPSAVQYLALHPEMRPALVVVPATIKTKWQREIKTWANEESYIWPDNKTNKKGIFIINYEQLEKYEITEEQKEMRAYKKKLKKAGYGTKDINAQMHLRFPHPDPRPRGELSKVGFEIIIGDEVQYISNIGALRSQFFVQIAKNVPRFVPISGTPIRSKPAEFFNVLNLLAPSVFPDRWKYLYRYAGPKVTRFGTTFKGATNLDELHEKTKTLFIRHVKEEAWKEMPPKHKMIIPLDLENTSAEAYWHADAEFMDWVKDTNRKLFETRNKLAVLRQLAYQAKRDALFEYLDGWLEENEDQKIVLFAYHKKTMDDLESRYAKMSVRIDGSVSVKKRQGIIDQFQNDKKTRVFIGQIHAAGVGIDLTAASTLAFIELWWVPADMEQCADRLQRRGQEADHVDILYLVAADTVEDDMAVALMDKHKVVSKILDGTDDAEFFDEDFLEAVIQNRAKRLK
jgi:hypothetical protein